MDLGALPGRHPDPGLPSAAQIEENAGALAAGPLDPDAMAAVDAALGRGSVASWQ